MAEGWSVPAIGAASHSVAPWSAKAYAIAYPALACANAAITSGGTGEILSEAKNISGSSRADQTRSTTPESPEAVKTPVSNTASPLPKSNRSPSAVTVPNAFSRS